MKRKLNFRQSLIAGLTAAAVATVVNAILFFAFHAAGIIVDTIYIQPDQPMTIVPIILASFIPSILAALVFFALEKFTNNGFKLFTIIALVLMIASFGNPFMGIKGVTMGYAIALNVMHVVVVGSLLYFIGRSAKNNSAN